VALFGNTSWIHSAITYTENMTYSDEVRDRKILGWQRMCAGMPFAGLVGSSNDYDTPAAQCRWADEGIANGYSPDTS
jgi:hypothetical protein